MDEELLAAKEAARQLGISRASFYSWLAQSNAGAFMIRGRPVTIDCFQDGAKDQARIQIEAKEIQRLKELMRVTPSSGAPTPPAC